MLRSKVVNLPRGPAQSVTAGPGRALERRQRAQPGTAALRHRALRQRPRLADAVIAGNPVPAELHARISLRSAGESDARSQSE